MTIRFLLLAVAAAVGLASLAPADRGDNRPAMPSAPGQPGTCGAGCSAVPVKNEGIPDADLDAWLSRYAAEDPTAPTSPLETLLFHRDATLRRLSSADAPPLDDAHLEALTEELEQTGVTIEFRVVDDAGRVRVAHGGTDVPFGTKVHVHADRHDDPEPVELGGRVRRVGLHHYWTRW